MSTTAHRNGRLAAIATGSTIPHIVAVRHTETAQRPIDSAVQLAVTPSPTDKPAREIRSDDREEVFQVIAAAPVPVTA
jgi:hypothetical protein